MYIVVFFVFANDAVNWCYLVCMFEKTTHRWLAVFSLFCGETLLLCGQLQDLWTLLTGSTPFWSGQADQLSPFSPCMSQVLHYCRLGFSALNVFLLHPGSMMQEFLENGHCLGWVQEDDSPFCRISTILWTYSHPEDCWVCSLDLTRKIMCAGKASHWEYGRTRSCRLTLPVGNKLKNKEVEDW